MMWYIRIGGVRCHDVVPSDRRGQVSWNSRNVLMVPPYGTHETIRRPIKVLFQANPVCDLVSHMTFWWHFDDQSRHLRHYHNRHCHHHHHYHYCHRLFYCQFWMIMKVIIILSTLLVSTLVGVLFRFELDILGTDIAVFVNESIRRRLCWHL